jgi:hypothetical protein
MPLSWSAIKILGRVLALLLLLFNFSDRSLALEPVSISEISQAISRDRLKVAEFHEIEKLAKERNLRVFLFGGTAAGLAQYVKAKLLIEKGTTDLTNDRFDFEYTHVYRHNQDLDIVVTRQDGKPESQQEIEEFQQAIIEKFPYGSGEKTEWEVRGLRTGYRDKEPLLNNPNYLNQHTDSHSTGMIELTTPPDGTAVIRDLREMNVAEPQFLRDVASSQLHYYFSPLHDTTKRAKDGLNPPILSAIRYLTKAFQYDLKIDPGSLRRLQEVISQLDPKSVDQNSYVGKWIEKNAKKLVQNATDLELAWNTIEDLGLRQKLVAIRNDSSTVDTLAWWLNKEPLRSAPHAKGYTFPKASRGKTAAELRITHVTHATKSFSAYEAITRSWTGKPNLLISRNIPGESASEGPGAYTLKGLKPPGFLPGYSIRFTVDPRAREGEDFVQHGDYIIWRNSKYLKTVPEPFTALSPIETFRYLIDPGNQAEKGAKTRIIRSASKTLPDQAALQEMRQTIEALIDRKDWTTLSETTAYDPARRILIETLKERRIGLRQITKLIQSTPNFEEVVPLRNLGMLMVRDSSDFLKLFQATGGNTDQKIVQGIQFLEALDVALKFRRPPSIKDLRALADSWFYSATHFNILITKLLPQVKTPQDYFVLTDFPKWEKSHENYDIYVRRPILGSLDKFFELNPSEKQQIKLASFIKSNPSGFSSQSYKEAFYKRLQRLFSEKAPPEKTLQFLRVFSPVGNISVAKDLLLKNNLDAFLLMKPSKSQIREYLSQFDDLREMIIAQKSVLKRTGNAKDFLKLSSMVLNDHTQEYRDAHGAMLANQAETFMDLRPSFNQIKEYLLKYQADDGRTLALLQETFFNNSDRLNDRLAILKMNIRPADVRYQRHYQELLKRNFALSSGMQRTSTLSCILRILRSSN